MAMIDRLETTADMPPSYQARPGRAGTGILVRLWRLGGQLFAGIFFGLEQHLDDDFHFAAVLFGQFADLPAVDGECLSVHDGTSCQCMN